jgi:hypothetical protein
MKQPVSQLKQLSAAMQDALHEKNMDEFSRLREQRFILIQSLAADPARTRETSLLLLHTRRQDQKWLNTVTLTRHELTLKINKSRHKRHALGNLSKAYVGNYGSGKFISRHG